MQQQYDQQQQNQKNPVGNNRRTSAADVSGGKRNFRSKRFSRNIEREPAMRRAQSLHMDRSRGIDEDAFVDIRGGHQSKQHSSGSSGPEDTMHFTATVQSSQQQQQQEQNELVGSYLARQEFSGNPEGMGDSGYMSHNSSGGSVQPQRSSSLKVGLHKFLIFFEFWLYSVCTTQSILILFNKIY